MTFIIGIILSFALAIVATMIGRTMRNSAREELRVDQRNGRLQSQQTIGNWLARAPLGVFIIVAGLLTLCSSLNAVDAGHVGVVYTFGAITNQTGAGLVAIAPWQDLKQASIQVLKLTDGNVQAASKETQTVLASVTINYQVSPVAIQKLYSNVGPNYQDVLIPSRVNNFFKEEVVKYTSTDVIPHREDIRVAVREKLRSELDPYSITVTDLLIDNIHFDDAFTKAIEDKQVATQNAQAEQNKVAIAKAQADQVAATAEGAANKLRVEAQGQADANRTLTASLTPDLIQYQAMQKLAPNVQIALVPSGQGIILDPSTLLKPPNPSQSPAPAGR